MIATLIAVIVANVDSLFFHYNSFPDCNFGFRNRIPFETVD